jgi:CheY-like chemotaxis protein
MIKRGHDLEDIHAVADASRTVLLVDDDADLRCAAARFLSAHGFTAAAAANGHEALDYLLLNEPPCCILLDLNMPVMDGAEFRRRQLANPALAPIPVVITTATEPLPDTPATRGLPILQKPFHLREMVHILRRLCEL